MKKGKIISVLNLPQIIIKQQTNKYKAYQIQGIQIAIKSSNFIDNLNIYHTWKNLLYQLIQYKVSKQTGKIKIIDGKNGKNLIESLLQLQEITINRSILEQSVLYSKIQKQELLKQANQIKNKQNRKNIIQVLHLHGEKLKQIVKKINKNKVQLNLLHEDIVVSYQNYYFYIYLKNINHSFFSVQQQQLYQFYQKNYIIEIQVSKSYFDASTAQYKLECVLPFQVEVDILKNGWGAMSIQAQISLSQKKYLQMSQAMNLAKSNFSGIWKNTMDIFSLIYVKNNFLGIMIEVVQGSLFKIKNLNTKQILTIQLSKIVCPSHQQLGAYQSRQFVRKQSIGKQFNIYVEKQTGINMIATLIRISDHEHLDKLIIQNGWGFVKKELASKKDTQIIRLLQLQKKCIDNKIGIHSSKLGIFRFEDLTLSNSKRGLEFYERILNSQKNNIKVLNGVIQKFKYNDLAHFRLFNYNAIINIKLQGVKSLTSKLQIQQIKIFQTNNKVFYYQQFQQRDAEFYLKYYQTKKGGYFVGKLLINKKDVAQTLLKQGLVYVDNQQRNQKYQQIQQYAKQNQIGLWTPLLSKLIANSAKQLNYFKATISNIDQTGYQLSYQTSQNIKTIDLQISPCLTSGKLKNKKINQNTCKVGNIYAGYYDEELYRVRVLSHKSGTCNVLYIDYGNKGNVQKSELFEIPKQIMLIEDLSTTNKLFLTRELNPNNRMKQLCYQQILQRLIQKQFMIQFSQNNLIILYDKKQIDITKSVNARLIREGLLKINPYDLKMLDSKTRSLIQNIQKQAKLKKIGLWEDEDSEQQIQDDEY